MGIRSFLGLRALSKRSGIYRKGKNGPSRHRRMQFEACENRLLLANAPVLTSVSPMTGPTSGGTQVTILGTDLAGATSVNFGTPAATIISDTATQIIVRSPAWTAGTVDISVTTPAGTSTVSAVDKFTYVAAAATGPQLAGIIPNTGNVLAAGTVLNVAPTQLTLQFNQNEQIDPTTLSAITVNYTNAAGTTASAPIGYLAVNDAPNLNQVIVRFSQTLLSGDYTVNIKGSGTSPLKGVLFDPNTGKAGPKLPFNSGQDYALRFTLDLGSIVNAVVPQPVTRTTTGQLQQAVNEIDVYFSDTLNAVSAQNPQFYQLITAGSTTSGGGQTPTSVVYNPATNQASLYFFQSGPYYADPNNLSAADRALDLNKLVPNGTQALRLRVGDSYQPIITTALSLAAGAAGTSYGDAYAVPSFMAAAQSYVISNKIDTTAYDLQWPGSANDPGNRKMVNESAGGILTEGGFMNGIGDSVVNIPTYTYNFPTVYGTDPQGNPDYNQITPAQKDDTRAIFQLFSAYFGVQFVEAASTALDGANFGVATGALLDGAGGGTVVTQAYQNLAIMDAGHNWGTSPFGGEWMQSAMQSIMYNLGFGRSYNQPAQQIMGFDATLGTSELVLPGIGDLTTALNLFRADSADINMYKVTLTTPGTLSAETIAQRLANPSQLNSVLRLFQLNADGSYSAVAQNDNFFSNDSYVSLSLPAGTYYFGVSASGNNAYDPSSPDSGMNGTSSGPYQLRVNFTPQQTLGPAQASGNGNIVLRGSNITVNTGTTPFALATGSGEVTIKQIDPFDVPSVAALDGKTFSVRQGSVSYTFEFVDTSIAGNKAAVGNIAINFDSTTDLIGTVRMAMVAAINDVFTVLVNATGTPFDGDADGTPGGLYNYWFAVAGTESSGASDRTIFVDKSAAAGGTGGIAAPYTTISAALAAAANDARVGLHDIVRIEGNHTSNDNPANLATISDNQTYNVGTDVFGHALSDGSSMVVPRNTTVMIDAGAVIKLRSANIQVGSSSVNVDLSGAALQVLGTPLDLVYITSWQDSSIGKTNNPLQVAPKAGDWGGIVFENDLDPAYPTRPNPEANGIFLDYVNHANLLYGGGVVSSNSVPTTFDPIYLIQARPTVSYNVIQYSADAAMSADPNSFQESLFEGNNSTTGLYTADYSRIGPSLNANYLQNNSINGMLVRIRTAAGEPIDALTTWAQLNARDITYVVPKNLEIAGNPGGPVLSASATSALLPAAAQQIQCVPGTSIGDGDTITITNSTHANPNGVTFEFDGVSFQVTSGKSFSNGDLLVIGDPATAGDQTYEFDKAGQAVSNPSYIKITFDPGNTPAEMETAIAAAMSDFANVELTGANITVTTGTTPFAQAAGTGGATIQQIDPVHVPKLATLNAETFTVKQGALTVTLEFLDTSNPANKVKAGNTAIAYSSVTGTIATVRAAMVAAINGAFNGLLSATALVATPLFYPVSAVAAATAPGRVALSGFTATQTLTFTPVGTTPGLTVVGTPGVALGNQRIAFDASQSADQIALDIKAAIVASGLYTATSVSVAGSLITIADSTASIDGLMQMTARLHGSLVIDPGVVVKLMNSRIEAQVGATMIAEGTANNPVVFTSIEDDRYGSGGTFDVTGDGSGATSVNTAQPGDWGGILAGPVSDVNIDHAVVAYAGGFSSIAGGFAAFNAIESRQGQLRVANSLIEYNADGAAAGTDPDRAGRGTNGAATIYVLGAQPVIVDNTFLNNARNRGATTNNTAAAISIDVNSLNSELINDWGRATGTLDAFQQYNGNSGPLVRGNILQNNGLNGMLVRSGVLSTQSVWDDTDIVYVVEGEISVPNLHTYGGLRLQSSNDASLVVKLLGANAGFTAGGQPLDMTDRVGGEVQIIGRPGHSVILTSLHDNSVGAGFDLSGNPQNDTVNDPKAVAAPGDWRSVLIEEYSNDRNVQVVDGLNAATGASADVHSTPVTAQYLGQLAGSIAAGDDTLRLGFEVHGAINYDAPSSVDVYSFVGTAGTVVYLAMDRTSYSLDSVVELIDADGNVIARSDNKQQEDPVLGGNMIYLGGAALPFQEGNIAMPVDSYSSNVNDAALRAVLPGPRGQAATYYVRVYSALNIGHVDAAHVPSVAALDGTTFQVADSNSLSIGDIDSSHVLPGIGIGAAGLADIASLNLETFLLTVGARTVTFQFVDTSIPNNQAAAGNTAINFNSTTDSTDTVCNSMAQAITAAGLGLKATKLADDSIAISGATFAFFAGTTPFQQQNLTGLNGTTFQITDRAGNTAVFEFVDAASSLVATAGNKVIAYNSTIDTIDSIRNNMVAGINSAGLACTAAARIDGTISLSGLNVVLDLGQTPFVSVGSTQQGATFEFIDTNGATAPTAGNQAIYYNSTTDSIDDIRNDMVLAINGYRAITGVDAAHVPSLALLNGETFQIADNAGNLVTFEFIDSSGKTVLTAGDIKVAYNSATDTLAGVRARMAAAINASGLAVTASAQAWGVALSGTNVVFGAGTTAFASTVIAGANCGATAQARPDGTIGLYGYQIEFTADSTPFVQYGRSSGSYQLQVRLQVNMEFPGSEVQYASIRYATNGIDIQGMPSSSPLVTNLNSLGTNTTFGAAQNVGNLLTSSNNSISVSGHLANASDVNWYSFQLSYNDIKDLNTISSFPLSININYADGLARPATVIWVFDDAGALIYQAKGSDIVDDQEYLGGGITNPNGTSYGLGDPFLGPIQLTESSTATYYIAVTGIGMTADALKQTLTRTSIQSITAVPTTAINLTPNAYTLADVTLYTNTATNLDTVSPFTGGYVTDVTGSANTNLPQAPGVTYGDIAMRPDGKLFGITDSTTSETAAGQFIQLDTGNAANAISTTFDGIQQFQSDGNGGVTEQTNVGFNINAMAFGPLVGNNWPIFVVGNRAATGTGVTLPLTNLLYELNPDGTAANYPGVDSTPRLNTNVIPLAALNTTAGGGPGGNITGMAYLGGVMYCVSDTGGLYTLSGLDFNQLSPVAADFGFAPVAATTTPAAPPTIAAVAGAGPTLKYVTTATTLKGIKFQGLTAGPADIINPATGKAAYATMLFAVDSNGKLYAFDATGKLQAVFLDGNTSVQMVGPNGSGLATINGVAFSNVDYNLWHTTSGGTDPNASGTTYYFGIENPATATGQPAAAANYQYQNAGVYGTYDAPGGAHGSLESTTPFSLADYSSGDNPTLSFNYYVDATGPAGYDTTRVFISNDGTNWTLLDTLTGPNNGAGWQSASVNLSAFAGNSNLQLRFDFSTAGDMSIGDTYTAGNTAQDQGMIGGSYLSAVAGSQLRDGDSKAGDFINVKGLNANLGGNFELDLGAVFDVPAGSGAQIANGQTFTINDGTKPAVVFELNNGSNPNLNLGTNTPVNILLTDGPMAIANKIAAAIQAAGLNVTVYTDSLLQRVEVVSKATPSTLSVAIDAPSTGHAITLEGNGPGAGGKATVGGVLIAADTNTIVPLNFSMTAAQVAQALVTVMNKTMNVAAAAGAGNSVLLDPTQTTLIHMIGHAVVKQGTTYGPLPYSNALPGDTRPQGQNILAGQQNGGAGVYLDNFNIGVNGRGQMITGATANTTFSSVAVPKGTITSGSYVLQIQRAPQFATYDPVTKKLTVDQTFSALDRMTSGFTLAAPAGTAITTGDTFSLYDGISTKTFEFVLKGLTPAAGHIPIYYVGTETATALAALMNTAVNSATSADFGIYSGAKGSRVNLFNAQYVSVNPGLQTDAPNFVLQVSDATFIDEPGGANYFYAIPGDVSQRPAIGETIIESNEITNSLNWGILVEPGARDPGSNAPHPGSVNPLSVDNNPTATPNNPLGQVGGVTLRNNLITIFGQGGIDLLGDTNPAGQPTAAVPFFRVVNNTIYGGAAAAVTNTPVTQFKKLTGTTGASNNTTVYQATLTGLSTSLIRTLTITDNSGGLAGGGTGPFSGLELDGITLSSVDAATAAAAAGLTGMNVFDFSTVGTSFTAGTEADPQGGPLFGTANGNVDNTAATLQAFDASGNASTTPAGFVSFGIGGTITFTFTSPLNLNGGPVYLYIAAADDVGGVQAATVTMSGGGAPPVGIAVGQNSAPTILNNIISSVQDAVTVDSTSTMTVLGATLYQNITDPAINGGSGIGAIGLGYFPISLGSADPLFVNASAGNFYLAAGSQAIGSGLNSLPDRAGMVTVETSLGLPPSPIIAPALDELGQARGNAAPGGGGSNIFTDLGAIARVDITSPTAHLGLVAPPSGSFGGVAPQWVADDSTVAAGQALSGFAIQLTDTGNGISNTTVNASDITVYRSDNSGTPLVQGTDYFYNYDATNHIIYLAAGPGAWAGGYTYTINVNNLAVSGIKDLAGNSLSPNRPDGTTSFNVTLVTNANFSHAPGYPVAWHFITDNLYLGSLSPLPQPYFVPSLTRATDDGVDFSKITLVEGQTTVLPITVTNTTGKQAYLNAWIDFNDAGTFTADEQVITALAVNPGVNQVTITVPASAVIGTTWARFRISTIAVVSPSAGVGDGEVEDFGNVVIDPAPVPVSGTVYNDIYHSGKLQAGDPLLPGWTVFLDINGNGTFDAGEPGTVTDATGAYAMSVSFLDVPQGAYNLLAEPPAGVLGFTPTEPAGGSYRVAMIAGATYLGEDFGNYYTVPPAVESIVPETPPDALLTGASVVHFVVTFNNPVTGVTAADFSPKVLSGAIRGATISSVTPSGATPSDTFIVTVSGITGNGVLAIALADQPGAIEDGTSRTLTGAGSSAANPFVSQAFTIDQTAPRVASILATDPNPSSGATIHYTVIFSKVVAGVGVDDFRLVSSAGLSGATISSIVPSGTTASAIYVVTVNTGSGSGMLGLNLADGTGTITDLAANLLAGRGSGGTVYAGPAYSIDRVAPMVASIVATGTNLTNAAVVYYTVNFSKVVVGVGVNDFRLASGAGLSGTSIASIVPSSTTPSASYVVAVNTGIGAGSLGLNLANGAATIADTAGNLLTGSGSGSTPYTGPAYSIDHIPPTVTSIVATNATLTNASAVHFTVNFSELVTGVGINDFALVSGAGLSGASITSIVPDGATPSTSYVVTVDTGTGSGTLQLNMANGAATIADMATNNLSGNGSGSTPYTGPVYTIDRDPPTVVSAVATSANPTNASVVRYTVTFSEIVVGVGTSDFSLVPGAGLSGTSITSISPSSTTPSASYVVTINTGTGSGSLGLNVANGGATITDVAGNILSGNGSGSTPYAGPSYTIDRVPPTVTSMVKTDASPTSAAVVHFTVNFSEIVTGVGVGDFRLVSGAGLSGATIASVAPSSTTPSASYVVTVSTGIGGGSLELDVANGAATIADLATNSLSGNGSGTTPYTGPAYAIDHIPPTVASIIMTDASATNAAVVHFTVNFSELVTGVGASDFSLVMGTGLSGASITSVVPDSTTPALSYVVTVNTGVGSGSLELDATNGALTIADLVGNALAGAGSGSAAYTGPAYTLDRIPPTVASIVGTDSRVTNAAVVHYTVSFSEAVLGVGIGDFRLVQGTGLSGASITSVAPSSTTPSASYTVTVNTGVGSGSLELDVANGALTIADLVGNPLSGNGSGSTVYAGPAYALDRVAPVASISLAAGQDIFTYLSPINFSVVFSKPVTGLTAAGIDLSLSSLPNLQVQAITGSGTTYNVAVTGMAGVGTVVARVNAGAVHDTAGNVNAQSGTATVNFNASVDVTVVQPATAANPLAATNTGPILFTVTFSQPVIDFNPSQLNFSGSTAPGNLAGSITGSGPAYTVAVSGMTGTGRVQLSIAANTVHNAAGLGNTASTGAANYMFYDITPPTESLMNPTPGSRVLDATLNAQQYLIVAYSVVGGVGTNTFTITDAEAEFSLSGTAASGVTVNGAGTPIGGDLFQYPFTGAFGDGPVTVNFIAGSFQDNAGNYNKAASYSFTVVNSLVGGNMVSASAAAVSARTVSTSSASGAGSGATARYDTASTSQGTGAAIAAVFSKAAAPVGPRLSSRMVAAIAALQTAPSANQKRPTTAVDAVFATLLNTDGP